jgi:hypothetical protein
MSQTIDKLNADNVKSLEAALLELIEAERQSFVKLFSERVEKRVAHFLEKRGPNETPEDFYRAFGVPEGIREATDCHDALQRLYQTGDRGFARFTKQNRPPYVISLRPDAADRIRAIAERQAEEVLRAFINRALEKLGPVVDRKGGFTVNKHTAHHSGFRQGVGHWEGSLTLEFDDSTKLNATLSIITNYTKYHVPYGQYPMRFFDCVLVPGEAPGAASIEEIWASVGYVLPPKAKKARWGKVVSGSVLKADGKFYLLSGPSGLKKLGLTDYEQVARITRREKGALVEYADTTRKFYELTASEQARIEEVEKAYQHNLADIERRRFAFNALFQND